jgi:hypothetical protein
MDRETARDGAREQRGTGHECGAAALEKTTGGGYATCGEWPYAAALKKMSVFLRYEAECWCALTEQSAEAGRPGIDIRILVLSLIDGVISFITTNAS